MNNISPPSRVAFKSTLLLRAHPVAWILLVAVGLFALLPFRYSTRALFSEWAFAILPVTAAQLAAVAMLALGGVVLRALREDGPAPFRRRLGMALAESPLGRPKLGEDTAWFLLALSVTLTAHFFVKISIHAINSRLFDVTLATYDRALSLGGNPAVFLSSLCASHPWVLHSMDVLYTPIYFGVYLTLVPVLALLLPRRTQRLTFAIAYLLIWILGALLYLAFPSWGPVFTEHRAFLSALSHMPLTSAVQNELAMELDGLLSNPYGPRPTRYGGVAAFPSLHLAVVTVFAWCIRPLGRLASVVALMLVLGMTVGSLITGYHYLSDGLAGVILGVGCCLLGRRWAEAFVLGNEELAVAGVSPGAAPS